VNYGNATCRHHFLASGKIDTNGSKENDEPADIVLEPSEQKILEYIISEEGGR
jgi:hypothetical protein